MTVKFSLRTTTAEAATRTGHLLDAFPGHDPASTVWTNWKPAARGNAVTGANDLLWLAIAVLAADGVALRSETSDGWTRDLAIRMRFADAGRTAVASEAASMLGFLTGDRWTLDLLRGRPRILSVPTVEASAVCLLSGGLDSLVGAINLLEDSGEARVLLVGVEDATISADRQVRLRDGLQRAFPGRVELRQTWATFRQPGASQARPLPSRRERTTRSRSFFFLASGLACASTIGPDVPLYVPENGLIGINVPLVPSRSGSLSTRTTHPIFIDRLRFVAASLDVANPIENPLRLLTKGEALRQCRRPDVLRDLAPVSVSCAHPTVGRWLKKYGSCGYCYPCLIRRASMHAVGLDNGGDYVYDVLTDPAFLGSSSTRPASLRALLAAVRTGSRPTDVLRNGPVPRADVAAYADLHARGLAELEAWLRTSTAQPIIDALPRRR
jgi:hypothetical protein